MTNTLPDGRKSGQWELDELVSEFRQAGVKRYLEIGARSGVFFAHVMAGLGPGSFGVAVDMPGAAWGQLDSAEKLKSVVEKFGGHVIFGDSHSASVRAAILTLTPFDACVIDADHRYEAVRLDWEFYRLLAPIIAFHDIDWEAGTKPAYRYQVEVPRLWNEIRDRYKTREIVGPKRGFGFGLVFQLQHKCP